MERTPFDGCRRRRIYLLRHADTAYFEKDEPAVDMFNPDLTEKGRNEATAAGRLLKDITFDVCYISGMKRTVQTAANVLKENMSSSRLQPRVDPRLEEFRMTELLNDERIGSVSRRMSITYGMHMLHADDVTSAVFVQLQERIMAGFHAMMTDRSWTTALVVLHSGVNRMLLATLMAGKETAAIPVLFRVLEQDSCNISVIDLDCDVDDPARIVRRHIRMHNVTATDLTKKSHLLTYMEELTLKVIDARKKSRL